MPYSRQNPPFAAHHLWYVEVYVRVHMVQKVKKDILYTVHNLICIKKTSHQTYTKFHAHIYIYVYKGYLGKFCYRL